VFLEKYHKRVSIESKNAEPSGLLPFQVGEKYTKALT
jgi:hypothetical protein